MSEYTIGNVIHEHDDESFYIIRTHHEGHEEERFLGVEEFATEDQALDAIEERRLRLSPVERHAVTFEVYFVRRTTTSVMHPARSISRHQATKILHEEIPFVSEDKREVSGARAIYYKTRLAFSRFFGH